MICTKTTGKLRHKDVIDALDAIDFFGFEVALAIAYEGALGFVDSEGWHEALCEEILSRGKDIYHVVDQHDNVCKSELDKLAFFYRRLAHKIYRFQLSIGEVVAGDNFLRLVK